MTPHNMTTFGSLIQLVLRSLLTVDGGKQALAQANALWRNLDQLVVLDVLESSGL